MMTLLVVNSFYWMEKLLDLIYKKGQWKPCLLLESINEFGLVYFLLGNVLTGFINFAIDTMEISDFHSVLIITGYVFTLNVVVSLLKCQRH